MGCRGSKKSISEDSISEDLPNPNPNKNDEEEKRELKLKLEARRLKEEEAARLAEEEERRLEEEERKRAKQLRKRSVIPNNYNDLMKKNNPQGSFKPGETDKFCGSDDLFTSCVYIPDNPQTRMHYLELQEMDPENLTPDEFDDWCLENQQLNAIGQHLEFLEAETIPDDLVLQTMIDKFSVYVQITDSFLFPEKGIVRALIIQGDKLTDTLLATAYYSEACPFAIDGNFEGVDIMDGPLSYLLEMLAENKENGGAEWDISSCNTTVIRNALNDGTYTDHLLGKHVNPGLNLLHNGLYEYKILMPFKYPLHRLPMKRLSKSFENMLVLLKKNESVYYKGNQNHHISIIGHKLRQVMFCRNELMHRSPIFASCIVEYLHSESL